MKIPLMPKGVEHKVYSAEGLNVYGVEVKIPLMPKGVEHLYPACALVPVFVL